MADGFDPNTLREYCDSKCGVVLGRGLAPINGKGADGVQSIISGFSAYRSTGSTIWGPYLARAQAELGSFEDALRSIDDAITTVEATKERWCEAETHRIAGEITPLATEPDVAKAEAYFQRALLVARQQQAKSWELRAAMSLARLWRSHGKPQQAHKLLAPVYGWFTEGFDTRDFSRNY
jgi:predicted ATPase